MFCAPGGIRTPVALRAMDLQSIAFDRSATDAKTYWVIIAYIRLVGQRPNFAFSFIMCYISPVAKANLNMSQDHLIKLVNKETGEVYWTRKNRKKVERKLEFKKYSKKLKKHVTFVESKK